MTAATTFATRAPTANGTAAMTPVVFGAGCVGWLHAPEQARALGRGVVLCPPFGYEGVSTYRAMRDLAVLLADSGLPVLRFDYPGAGESAGEQESPPEIDACIGSARSAAEFLRCRADVQEIAFAGCRFGALVAAFAAASTPGGTAALALLAPVLVGRSYARELRLLAYRTNETDVGESAGFPITAEFLADLGTRDLRRLEQPPAERSILITEPDRIQASAKLTRAWSEQGCGAATEPFTGYGPLMAEAHGAEAPRDAYEAMRRILVEGAPRSGKYGQPPPPSVALPLDGGISERIVRFGPGESLVGTWCIPAGGARQGMPALLIPGTGANMRVGNGRLSVLLARRAARQGIPSLRYDATGVGDSNNPKGLPLVRLIYSPHAIEDARHALDWLEAAGHGRVMIVGTCAGAFVALHAAVADPRVVLVVPANLQRFLWREGRVLTVPANRASRTDAERLQWRALRDAMRARASPLDMVRAVLPPHVKHAWKRNVVRGIASLAWAAPPSWVGRFETGRVRTALQALAARGTRVLFIYCSDDTGLDEFEAHLGRGGRRLGLLPGFGREFVPGGDHTLSTARMRAHFLDIVLPEIEAAAAAPVLSGHAAHTVYAHPHPEG